MKINLLPQLSYKTNQIQYALKEESSKQNSWISINLRHYKNI